MISFCKYKSIYKSSMFQLSSKWEGISLKDIKQKFEWRHKKNLCSNNNVYFASNGEEVIEFRAFTIQYFAVDNKLYKVFSPTDIIIADYYLRKLLDWTNYKFFRNYV